MKEVNVIIKLFAYDELDIDAKETAYTDHHDFLMLIGEMADYSDGEEEVAYVEDSLRANEYLFFGSGKLANVTHYTGTHEKAGTTELEFEGVTYKI